MFVCVCVCIYIGNTKRYYYCFFLATLHHSHQRIANIPLTAHQVSFAFLFIHTIYNKKKPSFCSYS